jgi:hypothetical protein
MVIQKNIKRQIKVHSDNSGKYLEQNESIVQVML